MLRRARLTLLLTSIAFTAALVACGDTTAEQAQTGPVTAAPADGDDQPGVASSRRTGWGLTRIGSFDDPVHVTQAPGDPRRLFVVEQEGRIRVVRGGRTLRAPFLDIRGRVTAGGEQGLLSVAFAPDYAQSGRFYVDYTNRDGNTEVVEYRRGASADRADPASRRVLLTQEQPEANHNGGLLLFGPDRLLYVGLGDGGGAFDAHGPIGNAQNLGTWLGKLLRIDPRERDGRPYSVPADNPFVGRAGARPEIWSWGLRNPWRFSFDRSTGDLTIGDVGQNEVEEIDFASRRSGAGRGVNYGWREWEGTNRVDPSLRVRDAVPPVLEYRHDSNPGGCSVTGGYVIRDRRLPRLLGRYVYADFCPGQLLTARLRDGGARERMALRLTVPSVTSFGEDLAGRIYVVSQQGPVFRIDPR